MRHVSVLSLGGIAALAGLVPTGPAHSQTQLPGVVVPAPFMPVPRNVKRKPIAVRANAPVQRSISAQRAAGVRLRGPTGGSVSAATTPGVSGPTQTAEQRQTAVLDRARENLFPRIGANSSDLGKDGIDQLPQGNNQSFDRVLLQLPGVTQDSQSSGTFHIRNEHANAQFRVNGIMLPEGISGFGQFIETSFVGNVALIDGSLPAQFGLRTAGIIDITSRAGAFDGGGAVTVYGGSRGTITPQVEYGGSADGWSYFVTGRTLTNRQGIENPAPTRDPIHDRTSQGRYFVYLTKEIDPSTRLSFLSGGFSGRYQIPNNPGQSPAFTAFGLTDFDSRRLNENQSERNFFNVVALQKSVGPLDFQLSAFNRTSQIRFKPDTIGDTLFNGNATDVFRSSIVNGIQGDFAYKWNWANTTRFGGLAQVERTRNVNASTVLPTDENGDPVDAPFGIVDRSSRTGTTLSGYVQHELKLSDRFAITGGVRLDQSWSYLTAGQVSPRFGATWTPIDGTTFHAGYARYFTPPTQGLSAPTNIQAFVGTTLEPAILNPTSGIRAERSHYVDIGVDQQITSSLKAGVALYSKRARNLLDDGQFGPALVLNTFNYDRAYNYGLEFKAIYQDEYLRAYANVAYARQRATKLISSQYLFGPDELAFISQYYVYTDHAQVWTASNGASLRIFDKTRIGFDVIYGSGLRAGFANTQTVSPYTQVNLGATQDFRISGLPKDTTLRFDVVNLFDHTYQLRDGSGIGVFAPQYGPRRGFFAGLTQRF